MRSTAGIGNVGGLIGPTRAQEKRFFQSWASSVIASGKSVQLAGPPPGIEKAYAIDITRSGLADGSMTVYLLKTDAFLRSEGLGGTKWQHLGRNPNLGPSRG